MNFIDYFTLDKKTARIALAVFSTIAFVVLGISLLGTNNRLEETENDNRRLIFDNLQLRKENEILQQQADSLEALVYTLKGENDSLRTIIQEDKKAVRWYETEYQRLKRERTALNNKIKSLENSVDELVKSNEDKDAEIRKYEQNIQKTTIKQKKLAADINKINGVAEVLRTKVAKNTEEIKTRDAQIQLNDLRLNTMVKIMAINFRVDDNTPIRKNKELKKKWKYTDLHFAISHPKSGMLKPGMLFAIELIDVTNNKVLPFNEGTGETALFLRLDDNGHLKGTFSQTENKDGLSYRFRISFIPDEQNPSKRLNLSHGTFYVVAQGKLVKKYANM